MWKKRYCKKNNIFLVKFQKKRYCKKNNIFLVKFHVYSVFYYEQDLRIAQIIPLLGGARGGRAAGGFA